MNLNLIKKDFPILKRHINGKSLVYLDSASTSQKPLSVIKALTDYYTNMNANIHRGIHTLAEEATEAYEQTREKVAHFINAREAAEIIFTRNTTESINLVAYTWAEKNIENGDAVLVSALEHHSNLVPWQELCRRKNAELLVIPMNDDGTLNLKNLDELLDKKVKLVAITQMSNVLGTIVPIEKIIKAAHKVGAKVLVDGAQGMAHIGMDVQKTDCDFFVFSSHKIFGPTGVGVLYAKREILAEMPPFLFGGEMVLEVEQYRARFNEIPWKFEAGTPNIADVIAFSKAVDYIEKIGYPAIFEHDQNLLEYARKKLMTLGELFPYSNAKNKTARYGKMKSMRSVVRTDSASRMNGRGRTNGLSMAHTASSAGATGVTRGDGTDMPRAQAGTQAMAQTSGIKVYGPEDIKQACGVLSFSIPKVHPHDIGSILNEEGVAIRAGHHCAQPIMKHLGVYATARMSFSIYNDESDVDRACEALEKVFKIFHF